jgi:hypothetical protein
MSCRDTAKVAANAAHAHYFSTLDAGEALILNDHVHHPGGCGMGHVGCYFRAGESERANQGERSDLNYGLHRWDEPPLMERQFTIQTK